MSSTRSSTNSPAPASRVVALVPAAGSSTRYGGVHSKMFASLAGIPVLRRTVERLKACREISAIVVMVRTEDLVQTQQVLASIDEVRVIVGGARRQDSVRLGLTFVAESFGLGDDDLVLVHDGARCLVTTELVAEAIAAAREHQAVTVGLPVVDTVKRVKGDPRDLGVVVDTLPRRELVTVQTPQVFRAALLRRAHADVSDEFTDDASMVEKIAPVHVVRGQAENIKITAARDLELAAFYLEQQVIRSAPGNALSARVSQ